MALTYEQIAVLTAQSDFRARVRVASTITALSVMAETDPGGAGTTEWEKRQILAGRVLLRQDDTPTIYDAALAWSVASTVPDTVDDAEVLAAVAAAWSPVALNI